MVIFVAQHNERTCFRINTYPDRIVSFEHRLHNVDREL